MQYSIINNSHHAVITSLLHTYFITRSLYFFTSITHFAHPYPLSLATINLLQGFFSRLHI